jgi:hypothetical protein
MITTPYCSRCWNRKERPRAKFCDHCDGPRLQKRQQWPGASEIQPAVFDIHTGREGSMAGIPIWEWIVAIIIVLVWFVPAVRIVSKAGYSPWWCVVLVIPVANVILYWVFAFAEWPNLKPPIKDYR